MNAAVPHRMLIVTGASRGIGAATARMAGARGYNVAVNYHRDADAARRVVRDIEAAGGRAVAIQADVAREDEVIRLFDQAAAALGPVTALVNNAGITGRSSRFAALHADEISAVLQLNLAGAMFCAREAVRRMAAGGPSGAGKGGAIVNLSSMAATLGGAGGYPLLAQPASMPSSMRPAKRMKRELLRFTMFSCILDPPLVQPVFVYESAVAQ